MSDIFTLVSLQPLQKYTDMENQWLYYAGLIDKFFKNKEINDPIYISLPEYGLGNQSRMKSEIDYEKIFEKISDYVSSKNINLIIGSFAHKEKNFWSNRSIVFENNGNHNFFYDKKHLFNFELKNNFKAGSTNPLFEIDGLNVKILICSDLWFPEEIRHELEKRIDLLIVPAMSVVKEQNLVNYGKWLWHSLAITRARENVIPILVSDWANQQIGDSWVCGASCIVDPSIRWKDEIQYLQAFNSISNGEEGIISSVISRKSIEAYKKYRQEVGLLNS